MNAVPRIRLTHLDGKLPNLALMKLSHWHRAQGDDVVLTHDPQPTMFEGTYSQVYASAIFAWSKPSVALHQVAYPQSIIGGTGTGDWQTVEHVIGASSYEHYDYSIYPDYPFSLGFTQRGCRLNCGFCVVPQKEGKPQSVNTIADIWQPERPRSVVLLDNDFFGQSETAWRERIGEIREGGFKVSFNQGINVRMITDVTATAIASVPYHDDQFTTRRLYTAWDNVGQETVFFKGLHWLNDAGIPSRHVMVYMLIGYKPDETMDEVQYRYHRLKDAGCMPYPMVYNNLNKELKQFQRWVVRRYDSVVTWEEYKTKTRKDTYGTTKTLPITVEELDVITQQGERG